MSATWMRRCQYSDLLASSRHFPDSACQIGEAQTASHRKLWSSSKRQEIDLIIANMRMPRTSIIPAACTDLAGGLPKHVRNGSHDNTTNRGLR